MNTTTGIDFNFYPVQKENFQERERNASLWQTMQSAGYELPGEPILDGQFHRFRAPGDNHGEKSGWYIGRDGRWPCASFGDWRNGEITAWTLYESSSLSPADCAEQEAEKIRQRQMAEARQKEQRETCIRLASEIWNTAPEPFTHRYLDAKNVDPYGLKVNADSELLMPVRDMAGNLKGLQRILPDGKKLFLPGTEKKGNFHRIDGNATLAIAEGYATAASIHKATGWTVFVAFDAGNLAPVAQNVRAAYPNAQIIICGDDDQFTAIGNKGKTCALQAAEKIGAKAVFPGFANLTTKPTDWNDLAALEGIEAVKQQLEKAEEKKRFRILTGAEILAMDSEEWRIQDILPAQGIAAIFGSPGGGKSFLAFDMAFAIARGNSWFGFETYPTKVLYINQESGWGVKKRCMAWMKETGESLPPNLLYLLDPVQIVNDEGELSPLIPQAAVTIIDTLSSTSAGLDENSAKDMGLIIAAAHAIRRKTGGVVVFIHHTGKDVDKGARGHSSLKGALDTEILVTKNQKDNSRSWKLTKSKESEDGIEKMFSLVKIDLGFDKRGKPLSSCVVKEAEAQCDSVPSKKLPPNAALGLKTLQDALANERAQKVHLDIWRNYFYEKSTADNVEAKKKNFQNARQRLIEMELIDVRKDYYTLRQ